MERWRIRALRWEDLGDLERVEEAVHGGRVEQWRRGDWERALRLWPELAVVATGEEDRAIGHCVGMALGPVGGVMQLAVASEWQGRGVGGGLLDAVLARLRNRGVRYCFLTVRPENLRAIALYRRRGFEMVGVRADYYGKGFSALVMGRG